MESSSRATFYKIDYCDDITNHTLDCNRPMTCPSIKQHEKNIHYRFPSVYDEKRTLENGVVGAVSVQSASEVLLKY